MKKTVLFIAFIVGMLVKAQAQDGTKIGAFVAYGSEIENIGAGVNAEFPIIENLTVSPSFIYFFPKEEYGMKWSWFEVSGNANYYFVNEEKLSVYALGGLNYSSVKVSYDESFGFGGSSSASDGKLGLNFGAGANFNVGGSIVPFAELKYVIIEGGQLVAGVGVKFNL